MPETIEPLLRRIDEGLRTSGERIIAAEKSRRQREIYISTSREAINHSNQQLARLHDRNVISSSVASPVRGHDAFENI